jgi:hypothetical protein
MQKDIFLLRHSILRRSRHYHHKTKHNPKQPKYHHAVRADEEISMPGQKATIAFQLSSALLPTLRERMKFVETL